VNRDWSPLSVTEADDSVVGRCLDVAYGQVGKSDPVEQSIPRVFIGEQRLFIHLG